jgi:hypothetical protein
VVGVGDAIKVRVAAPATLLLALLVAFRWKAPLVSEYRATVHGSLTTQGLVPMMVPPSVVHVTVLSLTPVTTAVTV